MGGAGSTATAPAYPSQEFRVGMLAPLGAARGDGCPSLAGHAGRLLKALLGTSLLFLLAHFVFQICLYTLPALDQLLGPSCEYPSAWCHVPPESPRWWHLGAGPHLPHAMGLLWGRCHPNTSVLPRRQQLGGPRPAHRGHQVRLP